MYKEADALIPNLKSADESFIFIDDNDRFKVYGWYTRYRNVGGKPDTTITRKGNTAAKPVDLYTHTPTSSDSIGFSFKFNQ